MDITQSPKNPLEPPTVEVGTSRRGGVATQPGMLQLGASGDASAVHQDFNKNTSGKKQRYKKRSRTKSDGSESLSDIDDSEVKKQKPATETKKTTTARKAVKTIEKLEQQKRSSRINYDALRILNDDMNESITTPKMQRSEEGNYDDDDDQQQITCGEDDVIYDHHNDAMSYGYEDEYNENFDFED